MKIKDIRFPPARNGSAPPPPRGLRARVLAYVNERPDEVFKATAGDEVEVAKALDAKLTTVRQALWSLARDGFVSKARLGQRVWYGSDAAIEALVTAADAAGAFCEPL